jgi:glycosyltransferase involved in cell wall biosynthesis
MTTYNLEIHIPCYNERDNILRFLESLQGQSYGDFKAIIHDNCSTDGTMEICRKFCNLDQRFELNSIPVNIHVINQLIRIKFSSRAEFVGQLSVNDYIAPTYLMELMSVISEDESIGLVYSHGSLKNINDGINFNTSEFQAFDTRGLPPIDSAALVMTKYTQPFSLWGIYRRAVLEKLRPMQFIYGGDHIFIAEVALYSKIAKIEKKLNWRSFGAMTEQAGINHNTLIQLEEFARGIHPSSFFYGAAQHMPFLNMIWGHIEMFSFALIDESSKYVLIDMAPKILYSRFGHLIDAEIDSFLNFCGISIEQFQGNNFDGYDKKILLFSFKKLSAELYKIIQIPQSEKFSIRIKYAMEEINKLSVSCI